MNILYFCFELNNYRYLASSAEEKKTELTDLVATIGGILGLFTGFSFLSLVEIFEIVFQTTMILLKKDVLIIL